MNIKILRDLVDKALENKELKGSYPMITHSDSFGQSFYIQNEYAKIRISDHSVTNHDRLMNEILFNIDTPLDIIEKTVIQHFTDDYITLIMNNGDNRVCFWKQILKKNRKDWKPCRVWFKEKQELPIKIEDLDNWEILEIGKLTKKGDKRFCKVLRKKYTFGALNIVTGEIIRTRFPVMNENDIEAEVCEI